jgi:hypothetical protein
MTTKTIAKLERLIDLANAQRLVAEGNYIEARIIFAKHSISYIVMGKGN